MRAPPENRPPRIALRLSLATAAVAALLIASVSLFILPLMEETFLADKRETIQELTAAAWSVPGAFARLEKEGVITREQAQSAALALLREMRYGPEKKDYFWVSDLDDRMLMHPYLPELEGVDSSGLTDATGKRVISEFTRLVEERGEGFSDYWWQWKDRPDRISPKESYIKGFEPWGWIIGTGMYVDDVEAELASIRNRLILVSLIVLAAVVGVFCYIVRESLRSDRRRDAAYDERDALFKALSESEFRYRDLFSNAPLGIYQTTRDGSFINANGELARLYGYASAKELMQTVTSTPEQLYVDPEDRRRLLAMLDETGRVDNFECRVRKKDGSIIWTSRNVRSVCDTTGHCHYNEGFIRDITPRVLSEQAMREARDQAEAASRMKTRFLSLVSHETLTPLTSILGFARLLRKKLESSIFPKIQAPDAATQKAQATVLENARVIAFEGERLIAIIKNVLTLSDLETGAASWNKAHCSASGLVEEAASLAAPLFEAKGLEFRREIGENAPGVVCDRDRVVDALMRLLSNAAKFTEQGTVTLGANKENGWLALWVSDTGPGVAEENPEALFGAFDQAGDALTDKPSGVGLGLAIAKGIIERHGGSVRVKSVPGQGSVFTLLLPAAGSRTEG